MLDVFFDKHTGVAEIILAEAFDCLETVAQFIGAVAHAHADTAAARCAFEHDRIAHAFAGQQRGVKAIEQLGAFQQWDVVLLGQRPRGVLEAEHPQLFRRRADKSDTGCFAGFGERGVFREKAIARMNRRGATGFGRGEYFLHRQIGAGRRAFAQAAGFVGLLDMQAGGIGFGIHRHALDRKLAQGAQDAAGDGATVGDQQFFEHGKTPQADAYSALSWDAGRPANVEGAAVVRSANFNTNGDQLWEPGLPAMAVCQSPHMLADPPLSQASQLPQVIFHS